MHSHADTSIWPHPQTTKVYMTEYNYGIKNPPVPSLLNGGLHGIFVVSRIMAGVNK